MARYADASQRFHLAQIVDPLVKRQNLLCSLPDDELSPAALAARVVLLDCARTLVRQSRWFGALWSDPQHTQVNELAHAK